ncbi:MAG: hypothetical protein R3213_06300, partial [Flavobacteriaceae bacterium]|nr:hypothetical protein [Flavobacteriaceae bacterium]
EPVAGRINTPGYEFNAFIAPDESFMIFSGYNRPDGFGGGDLYISFRKDNEQWSEPKNLGEGINSNKLDYCPFVDMNSKTLYFTSNRTGDLKNAKNLNISELLKIFEKKNGLSRIYKVDISDLLETKN